MKLYKISSDLEEYKFNSSVVALTSEQIDFHTAKIKETDYFDCLPSEYASNLLTLSYNQFNMMKDKIKSYVGREHVTFADIEAEKEYLRIFIQCLSSVNVPEVVTPEVNVPEVVTPEVNVPEVVTNDTVNQAVFPAWTECQNLIKDSNNIHLKRISRDVYNASYILSCISKTTDELLVFLNDRLIKLENFDLNQKEYDKLRDFVSLLTDRTRSAKYNLYQKNRKEVLDETKLFVDEKLVDEKDLEVINVTYKNYNAELLCLKEDEFASVVSDIFRSWSKNPEEEIYVCSGIDFEIDNRFYKLTSIESLVKKILDYHSSFNNLVGSLKGSEKYYTVYELDGEEKLPTLIDFLDEHLFIPESKNELTLAEILTRCISEDREDLSIFDIKTKSEYEKLEAKRRSDERDEEENFWAEEKRKNDYYKRTYGLTDEEFEQLEIDGFFHYYPPEDAAAWSQADLENREKSFRHDPFLFSNDPKTGFGNGNEFFNSWYESNYQEQNHQKYNGAREKEQKEKALATPEWKSIEDMVSFADKNKVDLSNFDKTDVKKACVKIYRLLAKHFHPDNSKNTDKEKSASSFKELQRLWDNFRKVNQL